MNQYEYRNPLQVSPSPRQPHTQYSQYSHSPTPRPPSSHILRLHSTTTLHNNQPRNPKQNTTASFVSFLSMLFTVLSGIYLIVVLVRNPEYCLCILRHPLSFFLLPLQSSSNSNGDCYNIFPNRKCTPLPNLPFCSHDSVSINDYRLTNLHNKTVKISCYKRFCNV